VDGFEAFVVALGFEVDLGAGSCAHHEDVGAVLFEHEAVLFVVGVFAAEVDDAEVAFGVADDGGVFFEDEEGEVAVVVHDGLFAEGLALVRGEVEAEFGAVFFFVVVEEGFEVFEEGFVAVGADAVGSAGHFHLEDAEVEAHLEFGVAIEAGDFADVDGAGFVVPAFEDGGDVFAGALFGLAVALAGVGGFGGGV